MVIKTTSSSLGNINDGQSVICLLPSKSWQNCNNICKHYFFHFLCAALVRDEKRCIPTIGSNITYEMISFPPFFFSESNFPQNKHLTVWLSLPGLYKTWGEFFCPSDSSDLVLFCGWDTRRMVSEDFFFKLLISLHTCMESPITEHWLAFFIPAITDFIFSF